MLGVLGEILNVHMDYIHHFRYKGGVLAKQVASYCLILLDMDLTLGYLGDEENPTAKNNADNVNTMIRTIF